MHDFLHRFACRTIAIALVSVTVLSGDGVAQTCVSGIETPWTITLPDDLRVLVTQLVDGSPTFRSQWQALVSSRRLRLGVKFTVKPGTDRARSLVRRYEYGLIVAEVELPFGEDVELLAHEFEHVREQLEGVDLRRIAQDRTSGVRDLGNGYETDRAYDVGRRVASEWNHYLKVTTRSKHTGCAAPWRVADARSR